MNTREVLMWSARADHDEETREGAGTVTATFSHDCEKGDYLKVHYARNLDTSIVTIDSIHAAEAIVYVLSEWIRFCKSRS